MPHTQKGRDKETGAGDAPISQTYSFCSSCSHRFFLKSLLPKEQESPWLPYFRPGTILKTGKSKKRLEKLTNPLKPFLGNVHFPGRPSPHLSFFRAHNECFMLICCVPPAMRGAHKIGLQTTKMTSTRKTLNYKSLYETPKHLS